jgi:hypothetical protein
MSSNHFTALLPTYHNRRRCGTTIWQAVYPNLVSAAIPRKLMTGKTLGVGAVGGHLGAHCRRAGFAYAARLSRNGRVDGIFSYVPFRSSLFSILGYVLHRTNVAALGANVNSEQEAQLH